MIGKKEEELSLFLLQGTGAFSPYEASETQNIKICTKKKEKFAVAKHI